MKILLLGGNGYLGSKVTHALVSRGHTLFCAVRTGADLSRLQDIAETITLISCSDEVLEKMLHNQPFDMVLNMACSYGRGKDSGNTVLESNLMFPLRVLAWAAQYNVPKFLTIGTSLPENLNQYSFTKESFGRFGKFYAAEFGMDFIHVKLEMLYGGDEPRNRFLPDMVNKMLRGEEVAVTLGTQHRDIIAAADAVRGIVRIVEADLHGYREVPLGTGIAPSIAEILDFIRKETGESALIHYGAVPMRKNEPDCVADIQLLNELFTEENGWTPLFWQEGLRSMIKDIKETL